jgi:hypothetical protein
MSQDHPPSVAPLFTLGEPSTSDEAWIDYREVLGLTAADVPALIRVGTAPDFANEKANADEIFAAVHAWRALVQLDAAEQAAGPLVELLGRAKSEWLDVELPDLLPMFGAGVVPALTGLLARDAWSPDAQETAVVTLIAVVTEHPETRDAAVDAVHTRLLRHAENPPELNTYLVGFLLDLKVVEAAPTLEAVFASDRLDTWTTGDWEDAQVELGLLSKRTHPRPPNPLVAEIAATESRWRAAGLAREPWDEVDDVPRAAAQRGAGRKERERAKARKKMARKSRKQNRRK